MRRKRATGRFYIFLTFVAVGVFLILRELIPTGTTEAVVTLANAAYSRTVDAVLLRRETVAQADTGVRITYVASEGQKVYTGDEILYVYSAGYSEREMSKLETVRENIRNYHQIILDNIVDSQLDTLENNVEQAAVQLKTLIKLKTGGSLLNLEKQLDDALQERQNYLRQNRREDPTLNRLYDEEEKRESSVTSWRTVETSPTDGFLTFYLDGCESFLTPENLSRISIDDIQQILQGKIPKSDLSSRLKQPLFKIVDDSEWYIILLSDQMDWNPVTGQEFSFQMEGYANDIFTGTVVQMQKSDTRVMAQLRVTKSAPELINKRYGKAVIGVNMTGLSVPIRAVTTINGQSGVIVNDAAGGSFVPVEVLSTDRRYALVQPVTEGTLSVGQRVVVQ